MILIRTWILAFSAAALLFALTLAYAFAPDVFGRGPFVATAVLLQIGFIVFLVRLFYLRRPVRIRTSQAIARRARSEAQDFVTQLSHEMRTPLTSILGFVETIELDLKREDFTTLQPSLQTIKESSRRLHNLCENMLILSKEQSGDRIVKETLYLEVICKKELSFYKKRIVEKNLEIDFDFGASTLRAKHSMFAQVFENLVSNAIRHAPEGSRITLRFFPKAGGTVFEVEDQGPGIASDEIERIFDPFVQVRGDPALPASDGFGLGLAIVRKILLAHGGKVWVESAPGRGSRFFCYFPS